MPDQRISVLQDYFPVLDDEEAAGILTVLDRAAAPGPEGRTAVERLVAAVEATVRLCAVFDCWEYATWVSGSYYDDIEWCCPHHAALKPEWWDDEDGEWSSGFEADPPTVELVAALRDAATSRSTDARAPGGQ